MAELTNLESKLAEVLGLAMAAQGLTRQVAGMLGDDDAELRETLERMHAEASETEERRGRRPAARAAAPTKRRAARVRSHGGRESLRARRLIRCAG